MIYLFFKPLRRIVGAELEQEEELGGWQLAKARAKSSMKESASFDYTTERKSCLKERPKLPYTGPMAVQVNGNLLQ